MSAYVDVCKFVYGDVCAHEFICFCMIIAYLYKVLMHSPDLVSFHHPSHTNVG